MKIRCLVRLLNGTFYKWWQDGGVSFSCEWLRGNEEATTSWSWERDGGLLRTLRPLGSRNTRLFSSRFLWLFTKYCHSRRKHLFLWNHSNAILCHCEPFLVIRKVLTLTGRRCYTHWHQYCVHSCDYTLVCAPSLSFFPWSWWSSARRNSLGSRLTLYASIGRF